ncbi:MAG: hypothetical protein ABI584_11050 [Acidobacteriota bacterium]
MLGALLPEHLDNEYRGHKLAPWLFGVVVAMKSAQSLAIILNGYPTARDADGIPVDSFTPAVAQTVVGVFAQGSLWRLFFCLLCLLVLLRYRSAIPLMFTLHALNYLAAQDDEQKQVHQRADRSRRQPHVSRLLRRLRLREA